MKKLSSFNYFSIRNRRSSIYFYGIYKLDYVFQTQKNSKAKPILLLQTNKVKLNCIVNSKPSIHGMLHNTRHSKVEYRHRLFQPK